jgi:hypothetical protein
MKPTLGGSSVLPCDNLQLHRRQVAAAVETMSITFFCTFTV